MVALRISGPAARVRGQWEIGFLGVANSIEGSRNLGDELVAQSWAALVVPKRGAAKLGACLRMQFEAHVAVRVSRRTMTSVVRPVTPDS
jgi:hypothetical protein